MSPRASRSLGALALGARGLAVGLAFFAGVAAVAAPARAEDVPISEEARTHFAAGVALLRDPRSPRYEDAYREFKAAYAASPSYKILGNLGLCAMQIERDNEAINAYDSYLKLAGAELTPAELEQTKRDLMTLRAGVVEVTISSDPAGASITDVRVPVQGSEVRNSYGQILKPLVLGLRRGHHVITAKLHGYQDQTWEIDTSDPNIATHAFTMQKPVVVVAPPVATQPIPVRMIHERPIPTSAYATGGPAVALAIAGGVLGTFALVHHQSYDDANTGLSAASVNEARSERSSGIAINTATDVCFGSALVLAGLATYFIFTRPTVDRPTDSALLRLTPALSF